MRYSFLDVQVDDLLREVSRNGERLHLEPQVMDLLLYLLRNRDRAVPRSELIESIWGGRIVAASGLDRCMSLLRRALGDHATSPRAIRTLHGVGYRFIAETEERGLADSRSVVLPAMADSAADPDAPLRAETSLRIARGAHTG